MNFWKRVYGRAVRVVSPPNPVIQIVKPFSLLTEDRLESLLKLSTQLVKARVSGAFIECGTFRGGSAALLAYVARQEGWRRHLYLFDSFQGHPDFVSAEAPDQAEIPNWAGKLAASEEDVKAALRSVDAYNSEHISIVPGWFQQTLSTANISKIALLHLDSDWYDSILFCLQALFDKIVPGGYIQIDDYYLYEGCRLAVDRFLASREPVALHQVGIAVVIRKK